MADVRLIKSEVKPVPEVVSFTEELLKQAEEGSITEVCAVVTYFNGKETYSDCAGMMDDPVRTLGEMERLKWYYQCWVDEMEQNE